jgi:hypothetical protein
MYKLWHIWNLQLVLKASNSFILFYFSCIYLFKLMYKIKSIYTVLQAWANQLSEI